MNNELKHMEISRELRADIFAGRYKVTNRLPSEPQLIARFKVSRPTVIQPCAICRPKGL